MANDFDCSIDYLVNEAMRYYARSKNYQSPGGPPQNTGNQPGVSNGPPSGPNGAGGGYKNNNSGPGMRPPATSPPPPGPPQGGGMSGGNNARRPAPPTPGYAQGGAAPRGAGPGMAGVDRGMGQPQPPMPQPPMPQPGGMGGGGMPGGMGSGGMQMGTAGPTLFLIYNGQRYPVTKDQFIIGRGSKTSDLAIKDGNISRKHAAVIRRNGMFYIKDLGSTNGIDYKGMRIDNKRIDEGDIFHICDYELRFTYR
jgi:neural Wiskott-Aldrich syndrome protein